MVAGEDGLERLDVFEFRLLPGEHANPVKAIHHLRIQRMLDPERAVLIEGGDAFLWRDSTVLLPSVVVWTKFTMACLPRHRSTRATGLGLAR